jgi:glycosyltransferase involved in cell wall biosynthesis
MPRVSVIALTLDHERFARDALDAIGGQTFGDFELIINDDGSEDGTVAVIEEWLARTGWPATFVRHDTRRGICRSLNEALIHASGDLVAIVSLDDLWLPDRLAVHVDAFDAAGDEVAVVYSDCELIDDAGSVTHASYLKEYTPYGHSTALPPPSGDVFEAMVRGNFIATPAVTVRRAAIDEVGGYDESLPYEDWGMWLQLAWDHRITFVPGTVARYRIHEGGYWSQLVQQNSHLFGQFHSLVNVHGLRPETDPLILRRLRAFVDEMEAIGDGRSAQCAARLAEVDPPVVLPTSGLRDDVIAAAAALIAEGYSVTGSGPEGVTLTPTPAGILYVAPWLVIGGADKATVDWFRYIDRDSYRRYLATTMPGDNALFAECDELADEAWCLRELVGRQAIPQFVIDHVATRGVDLIHIMNSKLGLDLIPALKLAYPDVPIVVQLHSEEPGHAGYPRYVVSRYDNLVDAYSVISEHMRTCLEGYEVSPSKIEVIYLGVDADGEFDPNRIDGTTIALEPGRFDILFPARLVPVKRPAMVLDIAVALRDQAPEARFHMVGDGELRGELESRCTELGLDGIVTIHGESTNMWGWFDACDAALLCSEAEGVPLILFEAMSMGVPTVAPLVGGIGELLDERAGIAVPADADAETYAEALALLAGDPERRAAIAASARRRVLDHYRVADMGNQHRALYGRLIARAALRS